MINQKQAFLFAFFLAAMPSGVIAQTAGEQSKDDVRLEERLTTEFSQTRVTQDETPVSLTESLDNLRGFISATRFKTPRCEDAQKTIFANKYVLTADAQGNACRIYDLSFPNLKALRASKKAMQVPVQQMTAGIYLNWLDGNFEAINQSTEQFRKEFNPKQRAKRGWISRLKFRNRPVAVAGSQENPDDVGLPQSFLMSDLDLGNQFQFDDNTKSEIEGLMAEIGNSTDPAVSDYYTKILNHPETLLEGIRFNWNDLEKVYDVILEKEFLPISGPVALIEYQQQYKYAVEKAFRGILSSGLQKLAKMIPNATIAAAVGVLVTDSFEQMDMAYEYQMLQLEDTLRTADPGIATRAMNVLYGERTDLLAAYLQSVAQGKPFDWQGLEKQGYAARYAVEKQRNVMMAKMNSKLVLEKQCKNEFMHDYFATCTAPSKPQILYSLISERKVFSRSYGAPAIFRFEKPKQTVLRRGMAWTLSIALRVLAPQIGDNLVSKLDGILKDYMKAGILDEALLRNDLSARGQSGELLNWLYIQNLNFFLPKSIAGEVKMIDANKKLLGLK